MRQLVCPGPNCAELNDVTAERCHACDRSLRAPASYVRRYDPDSDRLVLAHREVMEAELGRALQPDEHVHHINGDKRDNRPENLQVVTPAEHARIHARQRRKAA